MDPSAVKGYVKLYQIQVFFWPDMTKRYILLNSSKVIGQY